MASSNEKSKIIAQVFNLIEQETQRRLDEIHEANAEVTPSKKVEAATTAFKKAVDAKEKAQAHLIEVAKTEGLYVSVGYHDSEVSLSRCTTSPAYKKVIEAERTLRLTVQAKVADAKLQALTADDAGLAILIKGLRDDLQKMLA